MPTPRPALGAATAVARAHVRWPPIPATARLGGRNERAAPWLSSRVVGYDEDFLPVEVPLPTPAQNRRTQTLPSTHFTVVLDGDRKLAAITGVNVDGGSLIEVERGDDWHLDPRAPAADQCGPEVYAANDLDRGHLVRRRDPVWGSPATATRANEDTFSYANAAPQAALFNQGELLWSGLEDYVLTHARTYRQRLSVFTAPVFAAADPPYRGIQIPRRFWKVVAWTTESTEHDPAAEADLVLAATGYLLDQSPQLDLIDLTDRPRLAPVEPPPLGAYLTYQVPIADLADLTGLGFGPLPAADRLPIVENVAAGRWCRLDQLHDLVI